ncbi:MAG: hypothetical protein DRN15_03695 [Thermoprotei archaeon]|nr:MAG: hypothetical protein DRM97_04730 [Thermoprotei archaeon]RLF24229.1 MAG: hypothetical protein DRN15_03695 [Thermoprotei archaeon]
MEDDSISKARRALILAQVLNITSIFLRVHGGLTTGSIALLADGLDSIANVISLGLAYLFSTLARKPPDEEHPYGHMRIEALSFITSILIMTSILVALSTMLWSKVVVEKLVHVVDVSAIWYAFVSFLILLLSFVVLRRATTESISAKAEVRHILSDVGESSIVFFNIILAVKWTPLFDILATLLIIGLLSYGIIRNLVDLCYEVLDVAANVREEVRKVALSVPGVRGCHAVRTRRVAGKIFVDLHIQVDGQVEVEEAHRIAHEVEEAILSNIPRVVDVVIHIEPIEDEESLNVY